MSKERLEEIAYNVGVSIDGEKALMSSDDYDFLYNYALQQAERVEELEEERDEWKYTAQVYYMTNQELREQIKRYREALEEIMRTETVRKALADGQVAYTFSGHIARKALGGESDA